MAADGTTTAADVRVLYRELLGREPETPAVVASWVGRPLLEVAIAIASSPEHKARQRRTDAEDVEKLYAALLGRKPESQAAYSGAVGNPIDELACAIARSEEFATKAASPVAADIAAAYDLVFPGEALEPEWLQEITRIVRFHALRWPAIMRQLVRMRAHRDDPASLVSALARDGWPPLTDASMDGYEPLDPAVTLVIPTVDSERWLPAFAEFYSTRGLDVVYAVDARTTDRTRDVIADHGLRQVAIEAPARRIEELLPAILAHVETPWCLRIDDDELPSAAMISHANSAVRGGSLSPVGFATALLRYDDVSGRLERSHFLAVGPDAGFDCHWRLFRTRNVTFDDALHSPGFIVENGRRAPPEAQLLHFDWIIRSEAERRRKLARYLAQSAEIARQCRHFTVPELVPRDWHILCDVGGPWLASFARRVRRSFSPDS
jgi:hypothetical protein